MKSRLWYPQLDAYDAVRRITALLYSWRQPAPTLERLFICDFFFATPALLHKSQMPADVRNAFRQSRIPRPEDEFVSYPAAPILFAKMEAVQREALQTLVGKGQVDLEIYRGGRVALAKEAKGNLPPTKVTQRELGVLEFIVLHFAAIGEDKPGALRIATGLRRAGA